MVFPSEDEKGMCYRLSIFPLARACLLKFIKSVTSFMADPNFFYVFFRTLELLETRNSRLQHSLSALEAEKGISGYRDTQDSLARMNDTQTGWKI